MKWLLPLLVLVLLTFGLFAGAAFGLFGGATRATPVHAADSTYSITFSQYMWDNPALQAIPTGITWGVNVNGTEYTGTGPSIMASGLSGVSSYTYDMNVTGATGVEYLCLSDASCGGYGSASTPTESAPYVPYYHITFAVNPPGSGTIEPNATGFYQRGETELYATPNSGYGFSSFSSDTPSITFGSTYPSGAETFVEAEINGTGTITANFVAGAYSVKFSQYMWNNPSKQAIPTGVTWGVNVGGTEYTGTGPSIVVSGVSGREVFMYDKNVTGATGVEYLCWADAVCDGTTSAGTNESAPYVPYYHIIFAVNPLGSGRIEPNATGFYMQGETEVTATPHSGYGFSSFSSDTPSITFGSPSPSGTSTSAEAEINGTGTITANFVAGVTTTTTTTTVTSPTTTTQTVSSTSTATTTTTATKTSVSTSTSTATSTSSSTATATSTSTVFSGTCYDPEVTSTSTVTSYTTVTVRTTTTYYTTSTGTVTVTSTSTSVVTTTSVVPVTVTTTEVSATTVCATTVTTSSPVTSTTTTTITVTSPTTTTATASTTSTATATTATTTTSFVPTTSTATSTNTATSTVRSTTTILSGVCYDPEVTVTETSTSFAPTTETTTATYYTTSTGTQTVTATSTATFTTTTVVPVTTTITEVSNTTECSTTVSSSSSTGPPVGVPEFPFGSSLVVAAIGILALAVFTRVRAPRKPVPA